MLSAGLHLPHPSRHPRVTVPLATRKGFQGEMVWHRLFLHMAEAHPRPDRVDVVRGRSAAR